MIHHTVTCNLCNCQLACRSYDDGQYLFTGVSLVGDGHPAREFEVTPDVKGSVQICHGCLFALKKLLQCPVPEGV